MFNFLPWMDEVHIVEMGKNFLSPESSFGESILLQANGQPFIPPYYIGPVIQELLFRCFGETGTRLWPVIGLILSAIALAWFMKSCGRYSRMCIIITSALAVSLPLFVQSTRLVRIDTWVFFLCFLTCALLSKRRYNLAAVVAAISPFVWPSAIMLFPLYLMVYIENKEPAKRLLSPILIAIGVIAIMLIPLIHIFSVATSSLSQYFTVYGGGSPTGGSIDVVHRLKSLVIPAIKETLRAPFFLLVAYIGMVLSLFKRKTLFIMFSFAVIAGIATGMHTFRYIYLMPYFLLFTAEAIECQNRKVNIVTRTVAWAAVAYGIICGPVAYMIADIRNPPHEIASKVANLLKDVPPGKIVLTNGYSTYYSLRKLGITQVTLPEQREAMQDELIDTILMKCDFALLESEDRYAAIEESYTLYGLLRDSCLDAAKRESSAEAKSIPARIGEAFAYGTKPPIDELLLQHGFCDTGLSFSTRDRNYRLLKRTNF